MPKVVVDLSANNPHPIDFVALKAAGVWGVVCKATELTSEGPYISPVFGDDYFGAKAAGLATGAYAFWHPEVPLGPQLDLFMAHYGPVPGDIRPYWDAEINPSGRSWEDLAVDLRQVAWILTAHYGDSGLYFDQSWLDNLVPFGAPWYRPVWLAQGVEARPAAMMQFAPRLFPGCSAPVDWSVV